MLGTKDNVIYLSIADGKIVRRMKEPTVISKQRTTKDGKVVHEELYDYVSGTITDISTRENEYGKFWNVTLVDDLHTKYVLQFKYSGGNATSFLKSIPNADVTKPITIMPRIQMQGDKKRTSVILIQDQPIRWKWTKDNPGDVPQLRKIKVKGIEQWDDSDMMDYLETYLISHIKPKLTGVATFGASDIEDDDTPF